MEKIKKFFKSIWAVIVGALAIAFTVWALFRQVMKNKANKAEIERLRTGLNDAAAKNDKVIKEAVKNIKVNEEILAKTEKKLATMTLKEKVQFGKKMGY